MGATARLSAASLFGQPGSVATVDVVVRNVGTVVDQMKVDVVGPPAPWARVEPPTVSLFPGTEATVRVTFAIPRDSTVPPGPTPFAVRVLPREDEKGGVVEEGVLDVAAFVVPLADLSPKTSHGTRRARHELAVDNQGNTAFTVRLVGASDQAAVNVVPPTMLVEPGKASFAKVVVVPRERFLRGPPVTHSFTVVAQPPSGDALVSHGTMVQEKILPGWVVRVVVLLLLVAVLAPVLWFALFKPAVKSEATRQAKNALAKQNTGSGIGGGGSTGGPVANTGVGAGTAPGGGGTVSSSPGAFIDGRLSANSSYTVPTADTLFITDIVLQNPAGNTGTLQVRRNDNILIDLALDNFREYDLHFVTPVQFAGDTKLTLSAQCTSAQCSSSAYFAGTHAKST